MVIKLPDLKMRFVEAVSVTMGMYNIHIEKFNYFAPPHELQPDFANRTRLIIPMLFNPPDSLAARGI